MLSIGHGFCNWWRDMTEPLQLHPSLMSVFEPRRSAIEAAGELERRRSNDWKQQTSCLRHTMRGVDILTDISP